MGKFAFKDGNVAYRCPGCKHIHVLNVTVGRPRPTWSSTVADSGLTLQPSVHAKTGHYCPGEKQSPNCWLCNDAAASGDPDSSCGVCHHYVRDGKIQFLPDCTHALAGQTVDMVEYD